MSTLVAFLVSCAALAFSALVLVYVLTDDLRCDGCGHFRRREGDGWRYCNPCRRSWRID